MSLELETSIAGDWASIDGVEDVTFTPQNPAAAAIPNVKALVKLYQFAAGIGDVKLLATDFIISLWRGTMTGTPQVREGDLIEQADGTRWRVLMATLQTRQTRWYCIARRYA